MNRSSGHQDGASWLLAIKVVETSCPKHTMVYWQTIFMDVVKNTFMALEIKCHICSVCTHNSNLKY